ncbi:hypothetical protein ACQR35_06190 [Pseudarthrobacter sp. J1738]|uniref:hypothetical protein n=1 Tax=Pseudarthrobacter sp. J1738 TaxID=3420446 RepID=UPI003D285FCC
MKIRPLPTLVIMGILAMILSACGMGAKAPSDADMAAKYQSAVQSLDHVQSVESEYKTTAGMGRTGFLGVHANTSDPAELKTLLDTSFRALVTAAGGDPEIDLPLQVIGDDSTTVLTPKDLGCGGGTTLTEYRDCLKTLG